MADLTSAIEWAKVPLYAMFEAKGRWKQPLDQNIYSEVECKLLYSNFKSLSTFHDDNRDDFLKEHTKLIKTHRRKTIRTTEVLMDFLGLNEYWESIYQKY